MYVFYNLTPKDEKLSKTSIRTPVKIVDFKERKYLTIQYLNDDSTGNKRGEEKEGKETILPLTRRINYSICA